MKTGMMLLILLSLLSCARNEEAADFDQLKEYLNKQGYPSEILKHYNYIVIIGSGCQGCINRFTHLMTKKINTPRTLFVITVPDNFVDTSPFTPGDNVIIDKESSCVATADAKVVFLYQGQAFKTVSLHAMELEKELYYLNERIK